MFSQVCVCTRGGGGGIPGHRPLPGGRGGGGIRILLECFLVNFVGNHEYTTDRF